MPFKVWDKNIYPFPNFNRTTVEVWEWISHFIPHFIMDVINYAALKGERWGVYCVYLREHRLCHNEMLLHPRIMTGSAWVFFHSCWRTNLWMDNPLLIQWSPIQKIWWQVEGMILWYLEPYNFGSSISCSWNSLTINSLDALKHQDISSHNMTRYLLYLIWFRN